VGGVVLGAGTSAFDDGARADLDLRGVEHWEGSSNVMLKYAMRRH